MRQIKWIVFIVLLTACTTPKEQNMLISLELAKENRQALETVLDHYSHDPERLKAAQFLISNMIGKQAVDSLSIQPIQHIYDALACYLQEKGKYQGFGHYNLRDSLANQISNSILPAVYQTDLKTITSDFLIRHIDYCFYIKDLYPWCKELDQETFFRYVLPYTTHNYYWEGADEYFFQQYKIFRDTVHSRDYREVGALISQHVDSVFPKEWDFFLNKKVDLLPTTFKNIVTTRLGTCMEQCIYKIVALRANGIPATLNFLPNWGNFYHSHFWVEIIDKGKTQKLCDNLQHPFTSMKDVVVDEMFWVKAVLPELTAVPSNVSIQHCRTIPKIYRYEYEIQPNNLALSTQEAIPELFKNPGLKDITDHYVLTKNIEIPLYKDLPRSERLIYLCTYGQFNWSAIDWGERKGQQVSFDKIGVNMLYMPAYFELGRMIPASDPFILLPSGDIQMLNPRSESTRSATFYTKFPYRLLPAVKALGTIHTRFYLCNHPDLSDSLLVHTIKEAPFYVDSFHVTTDQPYRYLVCDFKDVQPCVDPFSIAEICVMGKDGEKLDGTWYGTKGTYTYQIEKISDNDRVSYYTPDTTEKKQQVILRFNCASSIGKVEFYPRSDDNKIVSGEHYELFYWDKEWKSLGEQDAQNDQLIYSSIPKNALFRIHNHTRGKEYRVFTYENNRQVWW